MTRLKRFAWLAGAVWLLAGCDPNAVATGNVTVGASVYYDSMLWNDYYRRPPPPHAGHKPRPPRPGPGPRPPRPPRPHPMPHPHPPIHRGR